MVYYQKVHNLFSPDDLQDPEQQEVKKRDPRREVTYEVFAHELWTKINKKAKVEYHASLVWTEIQSFIEVCVCIQLYV